MWFFINRKNWDENKQPCDNAIFIPPSEDQAHPLWAIRISSIEELAKLSARYGRLIFDVPRCAHPNITILNEDNLKP